MNSFLAFTGIVASLIALASAQSNFQIYDLMVPGPDGFAIPLRQAQQMATTTQPPPPKPIRSGRGWAVFARSDADSSQPIYQGRGYAVYAGKAPGSSDSSNSNSNKNSGPQPIETDGRTYAIYARGSSK